MMTFRLRREKGFDKLMDAAEKMMVAVQLKKCVWEHETANHYFVGCCPGDTYPIRDFMKDEGFKYCHWCGKEIEFKD